ncbi:MAG TPA: PQQ-binding-like beta-propeller repeat protein [Methylocella sp.]|nr:PQQ-binding-like beta-propeller repeat protein [Methylocella sp.]
MCAIRNQLCVLASSFEVFLSAADKWRRDEKPAAAIALASKPLVSRLLLIITTILFLTPNIPVYAGDWPNTPPDGWWWYYGQTPAQIESLLAANNARLISIQVEKTSPLTFTVAMVQNTGPYAKGWWWYYGQTETEIAKHAKDLNARVVNFDTYEANGKTYFAAIFISNTGADAKGWWWYYGQTPAKITALVQQHKARLIDFRQYSVNGTTEFAAAMVENTGADATGWWWYYNIPAAQVSSFLTQNGAYLVSLQIADVNGPTFNVIMDKLPTPGGKGWWWYYGESATELTSLYTQNAAWLRDVKTYNVNGQRVFTALMFGTRPRDEWYTFRYNGLRTGTQPYASALSDPSKVSALHVGWTFPAGGAAAGAFKASPIVVNNTVFIGSVNGYLYALDAVSGALKWQYPKVADPALLGSCAQGDNGSFGRYGIQSSATYANIAGQDAVIFGAPDPTAEGGLGSARLFAVSLSGTLIWKSDVVAHLSGCTPGSASEHHERITYSSPLVLSNKVYVGIHDAADNPIQDGKVVAVELNTGHIDNNFHYFSTASRGGGVWNSLASDGTGVYFTTGNTRCDALGCQSPEPNPNHGLSMLRVDRDIGNIIWAFQPVPYNLDNDPDWAAGVAVLPTSCGELIASVQKDGWSYTVNAGDGTPAAPSMRWQFPPTGVPTPPGVDGHGDTDYKRPGAAWNDVFVVTTGGEARANDNFGVGYGKLHALNACATTEKTRVRWLTNAHDLPHNSGGGYSLGAPTVTGGIIFVGTDQGHLVVLGDPSIMPGIGYQCSNINYTTQSDCVAAGYAMVPIPKMLADVAIPDGGDIAGLRNEPALARGRVFVGTLNGHVYMLEP